jgi:DNA-binding transcriptional MerR regulator
MPSRVRFAQSRGDRIWSLDSGVKFRVPQAKSLNFLRFTPPAPLSSMTEPASTYTIGALAREFDVTPRAIRFYEDEGLIAPERAAGRRVYGKREYVRLKLILRGKRLGFSLAEVREMLELYNSAPDERPQLQKFLGALAARREQLESQRRDIDEVLAEIRAFEAQSKKLLNGRRRGKRAG